jgi:Ulp1 family protease
VEIEAEDEEEEEDKSEGVEEIGVGAINSRLFIGDEGQINFTIEYFADEFDNCVKQQQYENMKKYRNHTTGNDLLDIKNLRNLRRMDLYMSDQIIDGYVELLDKFVAKVDMLPNVLFFGSYFMEILRNRNKKGLKSLYDKKKETWDLGNRDIILWPVCENEHWWLIYVDLNEKQIYSVDSLNNPHPKALNFVNNFLVPKNEKKWKISLLESQQQKDGVSCGAYCMFAMTLISFKTYSANWQKMVPEMIYPMRCYVFNCLVQREFHVLTHACPKCLQWYIKKALI